MFVLFLSELCSRAAELFSPIPFEAPPQQSWGVSPVAAKLLPPDALNDVWVFILISTVVMYVATVLLWLLCREGEKSGPTRLQKAYRVFNFLINTCFGVFGYYVHYVVTGPNTNVDLMVNRISAPHPLAVHLSHLQFAYQLWSIPVGLVVGEVPLMYFHHVLVAGLAWAVMRNEVDFLYYQCYYFGITELSSIPLAVMNFFKDSKALREKYPTVYSVVRIGEKESGSIVITVCSRFSHAHTPLYCTFFSVSVCLCLPLFPRCSALLFHGSFLCRQFICVKQCPRHSYKISRGMVSYWVGSDGCDAAVLDAVDFKRTCKNCFGCFWWKEDEEKVTLDI